MSFLLRHIARYAAQKLTSDPRAREKAAKAARVVASLDGRKPVSLEIGLGS
jgi:hypothetical protein